MQNLFTNSNNKPSAIIWFYAKLFGYFYSLFLIGRLFFVIGLYFFKTPLPRNFFGAAFKNGLYLDTATICYACVLPLIFFALYIFFRRPIFFNITKSILYLFSLLWALVSISEVLIYKEWKSKLSIQAVLHLTNPSEVFKTATATQTILFFGLLLLAFLFLKKWMQLFFQPISTAQNVKNRSVFLILIPLLALCGVGLRGGLQPIPIQVSDACMSNNNLCNDVAINPLFNFLANVRNYINNEKINPFTNIEITKAKFTVDSLMQIAQKKVANPETLWDETIKKPNIVFIILEGVSAHCSKAFEGDNFMPHLDKLTDSGLAFTQCYPSGHLSDMGNASILSGYPASPNVSVLMMPNKSATLPCINKPLQTIGYASNYYFGGQLTYGNIKQYLIKAGFQGVYDELNIESKNYTKQRLGINDVDMSTVFLKGINASKEPFLNCWFTISSHSPYDIPSPTKNLTAIENAYTNTVQFTDSALNIFFRHAKKQKWYDNTLFIIVSDHSHASHQNKNITDAAYHRIPLLFYGNVLQKKWLGKKINYPVSQLDITYTLLESLALQQELPKYNFSKSLLNTTTHFAPFTYFSGAGLVYDSSYVCYDLRNLLVPAFKKNNTPTLQNLSKAVSAVNYEDYRKR